MAVTIGTPQSVASAHTPTKTNWSAMAMVTTLFFMWGFITCLNDILIPHLRSIFSLNYAQAMLVQFAFFSGYFIFALPSGKIIELIGYKRSMVVGLLTMAVGAVFFFPAASVPSFPIFLAALMIVAAGITLLQVSANPYVTVLGPPQTASSRLNLTQAFNSLGTTVAPFFGGALILGAAVKTVDELRVMDPAAVQAYRIMQASSVKLPYALIAGALVLLALVIARYRLPDIATAETAAEASRHDSIWRYSHLILGVVGIFVYVGAEVAIGSFLINYFTQPNIGIQSEEQAAHYVAIYWMCAMIGRFIGSAILQRLSAGVLLGFAAGGATLLVLISMMTAGPLAMWSIILVGLFNSIMFPSIFTLAITGLGPLTTKGSGLVVMGIVGGALIPLLEGAIADSIGIQHAFFIPVLCYIFIAYYGFRGSKPTHTAATELEAV